MCTPVTPVFTPLQVNTGVHTLQPCAHQRAPPCTPVCTWCAHDVHTGVHMLKNKGNLRVARIVRVARVARMARMALTRARVARMAVTRLVLTSPQPDWLLHVIQVRHPLRCRVKDFFSLKNHLTKCTLTRMQSQPREGPPPPTRKNVVTYLNNCI